MQVWSTLDKMEQSYTSFYSVRDGLLKKLLTPVVTFDLEVTFNITKSLGFLRSFFHPSLVEIGQDGAKLCQFLRYSKVMPVFIALRTDGKWIP